MSTVYSDFHIVQAPYAIAAYAANLAKGPAINTITPTATRAAPSHDVRSSNLSLIQFFIILLPDGCDL